MALGFRPSRNSSDYIQVQMAERQPIAFLSYVRSDDDHDDGRISAFRKRLEGEVRMQTGRPFAIFQDRNDIAWGQNWEERINSSLSDVTFLIPILTPSFFQSPACRSEFQTFSLKEKMLGVNRLILPLYYVVCDQLGDGYQVGSDDVADVLRSRNWTDWRNYRFKPFNDEAVASALAGMAGMVKSSIKEIDAIGAAAGKSDEKKFEPDSGADSGLPEIVPEDEIPPLGKTATAILDMQPKSGPGYDIAEARSAITLNKATWNDITTKPYYVYTRRFDEVVEAGELADKGELLRLYKYVSNFAAALKKLHDATLISKLSQFRLTADGTPLAVAILIDNSGSMRGSKIIHAAAWSLLIVEWMDRLGIPTEILGFTTRAWKGGQSREAWLADGKPVNPGRLNDLRHLVYKSFSMTAEVSALNFGVMAREGLLKENIDGEALLWAAARLENQPANRKILFVLSDGASVDDSTLSVNPSDFLEKHLKTVIASLSKKMTLQAIGLGHDVSNYYPNAVSLEDTSSLGLRFFDILINDPTFLESWKIEQPRLARKRNK